LSERKGLVQKTSGSLKLEKRSKPKKPDAALIRHSSLGILPSAVGFAGGVFYDDHYNDFAKKKKDSQSHRPGAMARDRYFYFKKYLR
jgi:hypothetical protein